MTRICHVIHFVSNLKVHFTGFLVLIILSLITCRSYAQEAERIGNPKQEIYSRVQVKTNPIQFAKMAEQIGFDHLCFESDGSFTGEFSQTEIAQMNSLGAKVKILVPDLVKYLEEKNSNAKLNLSNNANLTLPAGFTYGSMGGYLTYSEIVAKLDQLHSMYPNLVSVKQSIGKSTENRDLWVIKISDNPAIDENEPKVFYNAMTHAREPMSMMQMFYYICYILQNYTSDPEIKHLVDNRELYFMPCANPDGYEYNRAISPGGGGMWRKNRYKLTTMNVTYIKKTKKYDTTYTYTYYGVDLNRNFGYKWGYDNSGSSNNPSSDIFRGIEAFSEPETKAIRNFCVQKKFNYVMNNHSYGNDFIYPYNYAGGVSNPDQSYYNLLNNLLTENNGLNIGHTMDVLGYYSNGEGNDWQYGEQTIKPKTFSWTPELGTSTDGFWPTQDRIEPLCLSMVRLNTNFAWVGGEYFRQTAPANLTASATTFTVPVTIVNYGNCTGSVEKIKFISNDGNSTGNDSVFLGGISSGSTITRNLALDLSAYHGSGTVSGTLRLCYADGYKQDVPFSFNYSLPALRQKETSQAAEKKIQAAYSVFPNPTTGMVYVSSRNSDIPYSVSVYNMMGEEIGKVENQNQIDLSGFPKGVYLINIEAADGIVINRVVKQ